jgi:hypothetical protein
MVGMWSANTYLISCDRQTAACRMMRGRMTLAYMMIGMNMEGRSLLRRMLVMGSNTAYDTKKMVRVALYAPVLRLRSFPSPAIFALPMLVRSRKASR